MFECQICGLLSLGGTACPACGSQLRTDLSREEMSGDVLPTEVPGLDDAAAAWYDLEGIEPPEEEAAEPEPDAPAPSNLPFGFQGESNVYDSRLPFGIGSFAEGIPFDPNQHDATFEPVVEKAEQVVSPAPVQGQPRSNDVPEPQPAQPDDANAHVEPLAPVVPAQEPPVSEAEPSAAPTLPEVADTPAPPASVEDIAQTSRSTPPPPPTSTPPAPPPPPTSTPPSPPPPPSAPATSGEPLRLTSARLITTDPVQEVPAVPDYWKIDAEIPNYEQIYGQDEAVVEMEYGSLEEDVIVYDHGADSPAAVFHSPLEASPSSTTKPSVKLRLHPAQALRVDVGASPAMQTTLQEGFQAMQAGDWSSAARAFQKMAASMPDNAEVYNNYGIALLQRATTMRDGGDAQQKSVASTQFESSILALREAAKNAPTNGDILVNLAIALIESGRPEKALGIMNVHNARTPGSSKGLNAAAVAMFELGQLTQAVETLGKAGDDSLVAGNLAQLSPKAALS